MTNVEKLNSLVSNEFSMAYYNDLKTVLEQVDMINTAKDSMSKNPAYIILPDYELKERYLNGESQLSLARRYHVSNQTIKRRLKEIGVELRKDNRGKYETRIKNM